MTGTFRLRLSPWLLPIAAAGVFLGQGRLLALLCATMLAHELAHVGAAFAVGLSVRELSVMPFGASMTLDTPPDGAPGAEAVVALAGPAANLLIAMAAVFLHRFFPFAEGLLRDIVRLSLSFCAFNLLPALPLDGGRVLRAVLTHRLTAAGATRVVLAAGRALGAVLLGMFVYGAVYGVVNATFLSAAGMMLLGSAREAKGSPAALVRGASDKRSLLARRGVLPVRYLAASSGTPTRQVLRHLQPRAYHVVTVLDEHMRPCGVLQEGELMDALCNADVPLARLLRR